MVQWEYLKIFIENSKNHFKLSSRRSFRFCNKPMVSFFFMLTDQIEFDDEIFFLSVELFNKYLIDSMIKSTVNSKDDLTKIPHQYELIKEKFLREKYFFAIASFHLATRISVRYFLFFSFFNEKSRRETFVFIVLLKNCSIDPIRLIEYFDDLARIDTNLHGFRHKLSRDHFIEIQMEILLTIDYQFPQYTPHLFISYFIRFLNDQTQLNNERLYKSSMIVLIHIYLQWNSLIEILAKRESGLTSIHQNQIGTIIDRFRDPLLLGSSTILAASKMFCHSTNAQLHDKIVSLFVSLLGIDPMRIYMAQFFAEEVLQKSVQKDFHLQKSTSRILIDREHDFDDESIRTYSSP